MYMSIKGKGSGPQPEDQGKCLRGPRQRCAQRSRAYRGTYVRIRTHARTHAPTHALHCTALHCTSLHHQASNNTRTRARARTTTAKPQPACVRAQQLTHLGSDCINEDCCTFQVVGRYSRFQRLLQRILQRQRVRGLLQRPIPCVMQL